MLEPNEQETEEYLIIEEKEEDQMLEQQKNYVILYVCSQCSKEFNDEEVFVNHELKCIRQRARYYLTQMKIRKRPRKRSIDDSAESESSSKIQILLNQGQMRFRLEQHHNDENEEIESEETVEEEGSQFQDENCSNSGWNEVILPDSASGQDTTNNENNSEDSDFEEEEDEDEFKYFLCHLCHVHLPIRNYKDHFMNHPKPKSSKVSRNTTASTEECLLIELSSEDEEAES